MSHGDLLADAIFMAFARKALVAIGKPDVIPDAEVIARIVAAYTFRFEDGAFVLVPRVAELPEEVEA